MVDIEEDIFVFSIGVGVGFDIGLLDIFIFILMAGFWYYLFFEWVGLRIVFFLLEGIFFRIESSI